MLVSASAEYSCLFAVYYDSLLAHSSMLMHFIVFNSISHNVCIYVSVLLYSVSFYVSDD